MSEQDDFLRAKAERIKQRYGSPKPQAPDPPKKAKLTEEQSIILTDFKKELFKRVVIGSRLSEPLPPLEETHAYKRLASSGIKFQRPPPKDPGIIVNYDKIIDEIVAGLPTEDAPILTAIGNIDPICPYCNAVFPRKPKAKTKCKTCGNFVYVRTRPLDGVNVLVTSEQANKIEIQYDFKDYAKNEGIYASMRNALKGHLKRYQESGYDGWIFLGVLDERSPIEEVELHGKIFRRGSPEELIALMVMCRTDCRARPVAWFNDSKYDRSQKYYALSRYNWAMKELGALSESERMTERAQKLLVIISRDKKDAMQGKLTIDEENRRNRDPTLRWDD